MPITRQSYFLPTQISGCIQWLDAADNTTIYSSYPGTLAGNSSTVTQWNDKSGAGNHVYQNASSTCPTFTLASNALNFAGGGGLWNSVGYALSSNVSFFTVMISPGTGWGTWGTLWGHFRSGGHDADIQFRQESLTNGYVSWHTNNNNNNYLAIPTVGTKTLYSCTMSNGVNMFLQNSYSGSTASATYTEGAMTIAGGTVAPFWIGRSDSGEVYNGYICEIIYYNQKVSDTQRRQVEAYLAQKWNLTASLPTGHPGLISLLYRNLQTTFTKTQYYTAFSPKQIAGCALWLDAADASSVTTSGTTVTAIRDKSTRATVLTSPAGFTYPNNTFNGAYPSFYNTSASGGRLGYNTTYSLGSQNTVFIVGQLTSPSVGNQFFDFIDGYTSSSRFFLFSSPNYLNNYVYGTNGSSSGQVSGAVTTAQMTSPFFWSVAFDTSTTISSTLQYVNGTQLVQSPSTLGAAISSYTGIIIGQRFNQSAESVVGHICEFIIFDNVLTTNQRQQVESYLAQKWGLVSSLPTVGHIHNTFPAGSPTAIQPFVSRIRPALTNIIRLAVFSYTGSIQTYIVPAGKTSATIYIWGAAGGGDPYGNSGGAGAFITGIMPVTPGVTYYIVVGGGGRGLYDYPALYVNPGGYGGGGTGYYAAGGGGYSGIFSGLTPAQGNTLLLAGGGGGAGPGGYGGSAAWSGTAQAGGGGGVAGSAGQGATTSAGGAAGTPQTQGVNGTTYPGTALAGGNGCQNYGGAGGGGYWGGGGGTYNNGANGGGGGSSYSNSTYLSSVSGAQSTTGSGSTVAPGNTNPYYVSGVGAAGVSGASGGNGLVVIN